MPESSLSNAQVSQQTERRLLTQMDLVFRWLGIAEQRHNWLVLLGVAAQAVLLSVITSTTDPNPRYGIGLAAAIILAGILISVSSFFPGSRLTQRLSGAFGGTKDDDDLFFYGHLARYEPDALVRSIEALYLEAPAESVVVNRVLHDLAEQVIQTAKLVEVKLRTFSIALLVIAMGSVVALVSALIALSD